MLCNEAFKEEEKWKLKVDEKFLVSALKNKKSSFNILHVYQNFS
jgi:hypothetical protein